MTSSTATQNFDELMDKLFDEQLITSNVQKKLQKLPKIFMKSGKTEEEVNGYLEKISQNVEEEKENISTFKVLKTAKNDPYRGFMILGENDNIEAKEVVQLSSQKDRQVVFLYSGQGCHWHGMAQQLVMIPDFKSSFEECARGIEDLGIDLFELLYHPNKDVYKNNPKDSMAMIMAIQISFTDLLVKIGINPDHFIGFSLGEVACGYADGILSKEQAMKLAVLRGKIQMENVDKVGGAIAFITVGYEKALELCPPGVYVVGRCGASATSLAGDKEEVHKIVEKCQKDGIFARVTESCGLASHSPLMHGIYVDLLKNFEKVLTKPAKRSPKWISTTAPYHDMCSPVYYADNTCNSIMFYEALQQVPEDAIIIEIGPHSYFDFMLNLEMSKTTCVGLVKRNKPELLTFLKNLGKLYMNGCNIDTTKLYSMDKEKSVA